MAETRRFVIEIKDNSKKNGDPSKESESSGNIFSTFARISNPVKFIESKVMNSLEKSESKYAGFAAVGAKAIANTISSTKSSANNALQRFSSLNEDYIFQQSYSNAMDTLNRTKGWVGAANSGASSLAGFGPLAMVAGAALGAANYGFNQYVQYQQRMSNYYQQLNSTNFQTSYSASRLGLTNNGRGTEN